MRILEPLTYLKENESRTLGDSSHYILQLITIDNFSQANQRRGVRMMMMKM